MELINVIKVYTKGERGSIKVDISVIRKGLTNRDNLNHLLESVVTSEYVDRSVKRFQMDLIIDLANSLGITLDLVDYSKLLNGPLINLDNLLSTHKYTRKKRGL